MPWRHQFLMIASEASAPGRFEHHGALPVLQDGDATLTVLAGRFGSAQSPAGVHTPLVAVEVVLPGPGSHRLTVERP